MAAGDQSGLKVALVVVREGSGVLGRHEVEAGQRNLRP